MTETTSNRLNFTFNEKHDHRLAFLLGFCFPPSGDDLQGLTQEKVDFILEYMETVRDGTVREKWPILQKYEYMFRDFFLFGMVPMFYVNVIKLRLKA